MEAKKIIITGGATRVGAAIAESLARYDTNITIHYNKSKNLANKLKKELEDLGSRVFLINADLNNSYQVQSLIKDAFNKMKGLDCLINNASVFENDNLTNLSDKSFSKHMLLTPASRLYAIFFWHSNKRSASRDVSIVRFSVNQSVLFFFILY